MSVSVGCIVVIFASLALGIAHEWACCSEPGCCPVFHPGIDPHCAELQLFSSELPICGRVVCVDLHGIRLDNMMPSRHRMSEFDDVFIIATVEHGVSYREHPQCYSMCGVKF